MKAIELWDLAKNVFLRFADVFEAMPKRGLLSSWEAADFIEPNGEGLFWIGGDEDNITALVNTGRRLPGWQMAEIAAASPQVIWGTFRGYDPADAADPWITLHAIDSTFWRCETSDVTTREALMKSFTDVRLREP